MDGDDEEEKEKLADGDQMQTLVHVLDERNLPALLINSSGSDQALHNVNPITQPLTDLIVQRACTLYRTHAKLARKISQQSSYKARAVVRRGLLTHTAGHAHKRQ